MTPTEEKLIELGNALARAAGHHFTRGCPKISPAVPCTCGAALEQGHALSNWERLLDQIKEQ